MATNFPVSLQDLDSTRGTANQTLNSPSHVAHHLIEDDTLEALQTKVGIDSSAVTTTLDYKLTNTTSGHDHDGTDSKKIVATNLDITGISASQLVRVNSGATALEGLTAPAGDLVGTTATQTLTNKTLTAPVIATITNTGTITLPTSTDTLVGRATTDTLTNKTLTSPSMTTPSVTSGDVNLATGLNIQVNSADPKRAFYLPASAMTAATTNGAASGTIETATNKVIVPVFDFDTTTQEFVAVAIPSPHFWDASTVTVQFIWTAASGTGGVVWAAQGIAFSDDDALDTAYGTEQTVTDTLITAVDDHHTAFTSAITIAGTPVAGDLVCLRFKRNPADAGDTLAADARLIGVKVRFGVAQYDDQ